MDVVVVAYRRYDLTRSCLRHLMAQTRPHRLYLCDNGCDEHTGARVRAEFPAVEVIRLTSNRPYAVACNAGVSAGDGEVVVMLNNDVDVRADFVERLVAPLATRPEVGAVAALLLRPGELEVDSAGLAADRTLAPFPRWQGHHPSRVRLDRPRLICPAGAAAAFRRSAWDAVGGLDEALIAYYEDFDLGVRLRTAGWDAVLAADAVGVHVGSATHGHRSSSTRRNAGFGRGYVLRRYGVLRSRAALRALATEAIVVTGDLALSRDAAALRGRLAGWHAGAGQQRRPRPAPSALAGEITFADSLRMRRGVYERKAVG